MKKAVEMKKLIMVGMLALLNFSLQAQENSPKFTVSISMDSILLGNYFEVKYTLENGSGDNFIAPDFENFTIVGGPNTSTSMSFMNGEMTQSVSYAYYFVVMQSRFCDLEAILFYFIII